jgi:hypothetical protein
LPPARVSLPAEPEIPVSPSRRPAVSTESSWSGISIRASLALIVILTVCLMSLIQIIAAVYAGEPGEIGEPIRSLALIALGYFFSRQTQASPKP